MTETKTPSIPTPAHNLIGSVEALKQLVEVREGRRGDPLDAFVSYRHLRDYIVTDETIVTFLGLAHDHTIEHITPIDSSRILGRGSAGSGDAQEMVLSSDYGLTFTYAASSLKINTPQDLQATAGPSFDHLHLTVAIGTAPLTITSTTKVNNLNVDAVDDLHAQTLTATSPITLSGVTSVLAAAGITIAHAATAGNIHLPAGGAANQILKNSGVAGTGAWGTVTENAGALAAITTIGMSGQLTNTLAIGTAPFVITSTTVCTNLNADLWDGYQFADYLDQAVKQASSPTHVTVKLTGLTDGYVPYHVSDAAGLANGPIYTNGTSIAIGGTALDDFLHIQSATNTGIRIQTSLDAASANIVLRRLGGASGLYDVIWYYGLLGSSTSIVWYNTSTKMRLDPNAALSLGYGASGVVPSTFMPNGYGITINQGEVDGEVLCFQSTDVVQPFTAIADAATYCSFQKVAGAYGGLALRAFTDSDGPPFVFYSYLGVTDPTDSTNYASFRFDAFKSDGAGPPAAVASLAATEFIFSLRNNNTEELSILGNGELRIRDKITFIGDTDTYITRSGANVVDYYVGGRGLCRMAGTVGGSAYFMIGSAASAVCPLEVEDDGTIAGMIVKITCDDETPYGLVIGNDTYSTTDTNGLRFMIKNTGAVEVSWTAGDFTIGPSGDLDALKLTSDKDLYLTDGDLYVQYGGTSKISLIAGASASSIVFNDGANLSYIRTNTSDGSDDGGIAVCAGGDAGSGRGATVYLCGNEFASYPGGLLLYAGNDSDDGNIYFFTQNTELTRFTYGGNWLIKFAITPPSATYADHAYFFAQDINGAAGKCGLYMLAESEAVALVIAGIQIKTDTGDPAGVHEGKMCINTFDNTAKLYADGAWRSLATW